MRKILLAVLVLMACGSEVAQGKSNSVIYVCKGTAVTVYSKKPATIIFYPAFMSGDKIKVVKPLICEKALSCTEGQLGIYVITITSTTSNFYFKTQRKEYVRQSNNALSNT
jgi:hypothetical protein